MFGRSKAQTSGEAGPGLQPGDYLRAAYTNADIAQMVVDRDLRVVDVNAASLALFRTHAESFKKIWPSFDPERVVGTCIDMFHKNPAHQRNLLSDAARLPHKAEIAIGESRFALKVGAVFDAERRYVGNTFEWDDVTEARLHESMIGALQASQAIIEFELDGKVVTANENFCKAMGYSLSEIRGQHHSMFVDASERASGAYRTFWERLGRGEIIADRFMRLGKGGREIWIQASYNPVRDKNGKVFRVVKFATDVTASEVQANEMRAKMTAIARAQAIIEFDLDGKILDANDNFLKAMGYQRAEIVGKHHSMFADADYARSSEYRSFWDRLRSGEFVADKFRRLGRGGKEVWIEASYNPLLDLKGKPYKVVKFATDVTAVEHERMRNERERAERAAQQEAVVSALAGSLQRLSSGDLTCLLHETFTAEYEQLRADFNAAVTQLREAMGVIAANVQGIRSGAGEISQAADDLSRRTEQQAASLEETAAALDEITATVTKTAEGSRHASETVASARGEAEKGGAVVREAVSAMEAIETSARQISQIIGVIDEIAFQTNLLALNAGVEAARAGDAGRGFAVVASEVRALAQRSAEAAKEIKQLISTSSTQVETGVKLVGQTGEALSRIVSRVAEISTIVGEIASSAREQATGLGQVNVAVNQMDQATQQNAAMVEESTAASHSLSREAEELAGLVAKFEIGQPIELAARPAPKRMPVAAQRARAAGFAAKRGGSVVSGGKGGGALAKAADPDTEWQDI